MTDATCPPPAESRWQTALSKSFSPRVGYVWRKKMAGTLYSSGAVPRTTRAKSAANCSSLVAPDSTSGRGWQVSKMVCKLGMADVLAAHARRTEGIIGTAGEVRQAFLLVPTGPIGWPGVPVHRKNGELCHSVRLRDCQPRVGWSPQKHLILG